MNERYFTCDECGHMWNGPTDVDLPTECENCHADAVVVCDDPDDQEMRSEEVLRMEEGS